jgi:hypothetical protein
LTPTASFLTTQAFLQSVSMLRAVRFLPRNQQLATSFWLTAGFFLADRFSWFALIKMVKPLTPTPDGAINLPVHIAKSSYATGRSFLSRTRHFQFLQLLSGGNP